jgi:hypothetical protein
MYFDNKIQKNETDFINDYTNYLKDYDNLKTEETEIAEEIENEDNEGNANENE